MSCHWTTVQLWNTTTTNCQFSASVLLLMINCVIASLKWLWNHEPQASESALNFDNVMMQFIINKRIDTKNSFQFVFLAHDKRVVCERGRNDSFDRSAHWSLVNGKCFNFISWYSGFYLPIPRDGDSLQYILNLTLSIHSLHILVDVAWTVPTRAHGPEIWNNK